MLCSCLQLRAIDHFRIQSEVLNEQIELNLEENKND